MPKSYEGSHQQYDSLCETNVMMPMRDGVGLATDIYFPATGGRRAEGEFPVILERTPYDKAAPRAVTKGKYFARRGYVCAPRLRLRSPRRTEVTEGEVALAGVVPPRLSV